MKLPRVRLTLRRSMALVVVAALALGAWSAWFDPVRRWRREVNDDQNGALRWQAIDQMLGGKAEVDREIALATMVEALASPSPRVRETAIAGLGRLGRDARPAVPSLLRALAEPRPHLRGMAVDALVLVIPPGDPAREEAVPVLSWLLLDLSPHVRRRAASALAAFGHQDEALPVLLQALREPDYLAQADALHWIGRMGSGASPEALAGVVALESRAGASAATEMSRYLRVYAAEARYLLGDREPALASLRALAQDPDVELAREARRVLGRLPGQD